tara:strand:- start:2761 stop:3354 length:594 start_codon:yes stop_codon:yes gene_type:complete
MIHKNIYWFYEKKIPERICDEIIDFFKNKKKIKANIGGSDKVVPEVRKSSVVFDGENLWIDALIDPFIAEANQLANWNFDIDYPETHQFTEYKKNQHYDWHTDSFDVPFDTPNHYKNNKIRKLSMSLCLSDENTYAGGELLFSTTSNSNETKILNIKNMNKKGSLVVFPSHTWHKVTPITKGTRHSLVIWYLGNPYR